MIAKLPGFGLTVRSVRFWPDRSVRGWCPALASPGLGHAVERVVGHAPLAVGLTTIDAQEMSARFRRVAAGLRRRGHRVGAALVRQIARDDRFDRRPGLVDLDLLKRAAVSRIVRRLADGRSPAGRDHDVVIVREAAKRGDVAVVDRLQIAPVEFGDGCEILLERRLARRLRPRLRRGDAGRRQDRREHERDRTLRTYFKVQSHPSHPYHASGTPSYRQNLPVSASVTLSIVLTMLPTVNSVVSIPLKSFRYS